MAFWLLGSLALATSGRPPAAAAQATAPGPVGGRIDVAQIGGLIDPIEADFLAGTVRDAGRDGAEALLIQLNSGGGVISRGRLASLVSTLSRSPVPVAVWVGPNGARARGAALAVFRAAQIGGAAPGTSIGDHQEALATVRAATLGDFLVELDGRTVAGRTLHTAQVVRPAGGQPRRSPTVVTRFRKLGLLAQLLHTAASPSVAYLLGLIGALLVVLEFFTAGVGIAAVAGAGCLALASYGLGVLPLRPYALVLLGVGVIGYAIDLQAGVPRVWTVIGTVALVVGTVRLYSGPHLSPLAMGAGVLGAALFMVAGMPSMVRARFSTPTIGRQSMVGEVGKALADVDPEGTVEIRGAPWRARTNRATPLGAGDPVRVVAIDGLLLEVEPLEGGARDAGH